MGRMLHGLASRRYDRGAEPVGEDLDTYGTSKNSVSKRFIEATESLLKQFLYRSLKELRLLTVFIDGIVLGEHTVMVALGVAGDGRKHVLGMREGTTEKAAVCTAFLEDLGNRGLCAQSGLLFVVDWSKAIGKAVRDVYGENWRSFSVVSFTSGATFWNTFPNGRGGGLAKSYPLRGLCPMRTKPVPHWKPWSGPWKKSIRARRPA